MLIFSIILLSIISSIHCMENPICKRKRDELEHVSKFEGGVYEEPNLLGIPEEVTKIVLRYVMSPNGISPEAKITPPEKIKFIVKSFHPCFLVNKKINRLSNQVLTSLFGQLVATYPQNYLRMIEVVNLACIPKNSVFLKRFVEGNPDYIFSLTPRITPLMAAVGYNNENAVALLLKQAEERGILEPYLNVRCGSQKIVVKYGFDYDRQFSALHIAASCENKVSISILEKLLTAGASVNSVDIDGETPLSWALSNITDAAKEKVSTLIEHKADPRAGTCLLNDGITPYDRVKENVESQEPMENYVFFWQLFNPEKRKYYN